MKGLVGFIGVGKMGFNMAANLLKSREGYKLVVCDKNAEAVAKLMEQGAAHSVETPKELGSVPGLGVIISMLPGPDHVKMAYLSKDGLLNREPGTLQPPLIIDCSTIDPDTTREVSAAAEETMLHQDAAEASSLRVPQMIDAPVSGGVPGAISATLTFMCGGDIEAVEKAKPYLMSMGKRVVHVGGHGAGQAAKLANNLTMAISMAAVAEGLAFGKSQGIDPALLTSIFNSSSAQCWSSSSYNPVPGVVDGVPAARQYQNGFAASLMLKDLRLALDAASKSGAKLPMTAASLEEYKQVAEVDPTLDFSAIYKYVYETNYK